MDFPSAMILPVAVMVIQVVLLFEGIFAFEVLLICIYLLLTYED